VEISSVQCCLEVGEGAVGEGVEHTVHYAM